jgi:hypothetical protein
MALTAEEKATRKEARLERDRQWRARTGAMRKELEAAEQKIKSEFAGAITEAETVEKVVEDRWRDAVKAIDRQIADLQAQRKLVDESGRAAFHKSREPLVALYDEQRTRIDKSAEAIEAKYPDLAGHARWSAAAWRGFP